MPHPLIESDALCLFELDGSADIEAYVSWLNDSVTTQYLECRFQQPFTVEGVKAYVNEIKAKSSVMLFGILFKEENCHIGNIKLEINQHHSSAEVGIMIGNPHFRGLGLGYDALSLVVTFAFNVLNLEKITAGCYSVNLASRAIFEKAGFRVEGCLRSEYKVSDWQRTDKLLLGLSNNRSRDA